MAYPSVYPTSAVAPIPTFGMPGHTYIAASGPVVPRPAPQSRFMEPQTRAQAAWAQPAAPAAEQRVQRLAMGLLLTVVLLGLPLAAFLATVATH